MMQENATLVPVGDGKVRPSDQELHRLVCKAIWESSHIVFDSLPSLIDQIIRHKTWKSLHHKSFASYALDSSSNGLGINTNQRLWILRCSMDVHGCHVKEWADVLEQVEQMVHISAKEDGSKIESRNGSSLELLGKICTTSRNNEKITYLPSRSGAGLDRNILALKKKSPDIYKRVVSGKMSMREAVREAGMTRKDSDVNRDPVDRAIMYIRRMEQKDIKRFVKWLEGEGYLKK